MLGQEARLVECRRLARARKSTGVGRAWVRALGGRAGGEDGGRGDQWEA